MENVKKIRAFYYQDNDGNKLTMFYGRLFDSDLNCISSANNAQRWCFTGNKIPMPVRSGTWFQGFGYNKMNCFVESTGYHLVMTVNLIHGTVWHCPIIEKDRSTVDMDLIKHQIRKLYNGGNQIRLARLYQTIAGCSVSEAHEVVIDIINNS